METTDNKPTFFSKSKYYLGLILVIIIIVIWHYSTIYFIEKNTEKEKLEMNTNFGLKLDSLNTAQMQLTAKTFSWAIRSELIRGNKDQINQYFNEFIKTPGMIKLQFINSENSKIEISTDKKDEGTRNVDYINLNGQEIISGVPELKVVTPILGMNKQIGVFILEAKKIETNLKKD